ncbi:MAG: FHA domain-containing protein [Lachnospiraceae bacterium]|nr:FHA domain-containing protein [Lachnospiraceae bacterium]
MDKSNYTAPETVYRKASDQVMGEKCLIIIHLSGKVQEINLTRLHKTRLLMGRAPENDIVISARVVSGIHGKFKIDGNRLLYADLNSSNGTIVDVDGYRQFIRGNRKYYELQSGNMLRIQGQDSSPDKSVLILYTCEHMEGVWIHYPILAPVTKIGRDMDNDIVLSSPAVSRFHARIEHRGDYFELTDNSSANGVFVNGGRKQGKYRLREKDVIQIANHTLIYTNGMFFYKNSAQGINIEICNVNKFVDHHKKKILDQVNCTVKSNEFVAIVGGSGAGKTTLMNAISGFDKEITGDVFFNGIRVQEHFNELKNLIGYVPQEDIIYENLTLRRMLYYTAKLKMPPDTTKKEIAGRINQVLSMVELSAHQNTYIRKLSGGQKKRASIAVELLADPNVFFLDEPTSGLDPGTEQKLMITLNKLSKSQGKTIVMVTHTTQSLQLCDKVIFMGRGGRLCFAGTAQEAKMFFDTENLVDIYNMITEEPELWAEQFRNCVEAEQVQRQPQSGDISRRRSRARLSQILILIMRYMELIKNDLQRLLLLFAQPVLIAILLSVVANENAFYLYDDTKSILFSLSCAGIWIGLFNSIQEICKERAILKREYMGNLKLSYYTFSKFFVQTLLGAVQALLMTAIFSGMVGHPAEGILFADPFAETFVTVWLTIEASMAIGFVISALVRNGDRAMTMAPFVLIIQLLFSGILFRLEGAGSKIAYFTVSKWSVESLGSIAVLNDLPLKIQKEMPTEIEPEAIFSASAGHLMQNWLILAGMMAGLYYAQCF